MQITITAKGYQGIKAEVAEILADGARVIVNRKGIDLAPRIFYFTWDAIKGGKLEMEAPKPVEVPVTVTLTRKGEYTREYRLSGTVNGETFVNLIVRTSKTTDYTHASLTRIPAQKIAGSVFDKATVKGSAPEFEDVLTFHKSGAAALKGNNDLRKHALGVRTVEITEA